MKDKYNTGVQKIMNELKGQTFNNSWIGCYPIGENKQIARPKTQRKARKRGKKS